MRPSVRDTADAIEIRWAAGFRFAATAIDVCGNDPADLDYLSEFLVPWCELIPAGGAALRVRMLGSPLLAGELEADWEAVRVTSRRVAPVPCLRLDTQVVAFEGWRDDGRLRLVDRVTGCFFRFDEGIVDVVCRQGDDRTRLGLLGLIREAITGGVASVSALVDLHAAAFAVGDRAVVIAGARGSGKTSLLCHALLSGGAALIANDRTFVALDGPEPVATGIPTVVSIRADTLRAFPRLAGEPDAYPALTPIILPASDGGAPAATGPGDRALLLSPARFAGRLGVARVGRARLSAIVLPEVSTELRGWTVARLAVEVAAAALEARLYGTGPARDASTLFGSLVGPAVAQRPSPCALLERLVATVPVFVCRLGRGAYESPAAAWLEAIGVRG